MTRGRGRTFSHSTLRDLVRHRARSGAALAAVTFAVFLATGICIVASLQFENVLAWTGPNLASSQVIVYAQPQDGGPNATPLTSTQLAEVSVHISGLAARLHAPAGVPLVHLLTLGIWRARRRYAGILAESTRSLDTLTGQGDAYCSATHGQSPSA